MNFKALIFPSSCSSVVKRCRSGVQDKDYIKFKLLFSGLALKGVSGMCTDKNANCVEFKKLIYMSDTTV